MRTELIANQPGDDAVVALNQPATDTAARTQRRLKIEDRCVAAAVAVTAYATLQHDAPFAAAGLAAWAAYLLPNERNFVRQLHLLARSVLGFEGLQLMHNPPDPWTAAVAWGLKDGVLELKAKL